MQEHLKYIRVYIRVLGVSFGTFTDDPHSQYAVAMLDGVTNELSKYYTFSFNRRFNIRIPFKIKTTDLDSYFVTFKVYKMNLITKELLGKISVPLSTFPMNTICHEKLALQPEIKLKSPISILFDIHIDNKHKRPYKAPEGKSPFERFDSSSCLFPVEEVQKPASSILTGELI